MVLNKIKDKMKTLLIYVVLLSFYAIVFQNSGYAQGNEMYKIRIKVKYALAQPGDTLTLKFGPQAIDSRIKSTYHSIVDKDGICTFNVETEFEYGYISITKIKPHPKWRTDNNGLVSNVFWENGDDILINIPDNIKINDYRTNTTFNGKGSGKYNALYEIQEAQQKYYEDAHNTSLAETSYFLNPLTDTINVSSEKAERLLSVLNRNKCNLSSLAYDVLKTDIIFLDPSQASEMIEVYYDSHIKIAPDSIQELYKKRIHKLFLRYLKLDVSDEGMASSYAFQKLHSNIFYILSQLEDRSSNIAIALKNISVVDDGVKKESIILSTLNKLGVKENKGEIDILKKSIRTPRYQLMLKKQLEFVGKNILEYSFIDTLGNKVELSEYRGKLLLIDFWYSGCSGCAKLYQTVLSKIEEEYKDNPKFAVISISCDTKMEKWLSSIKKNQYTNEDCINLSTGAIGMTHPFVSDMGIFKYPYVMLVDHNGNVIMTDVVELRSSVETMKEIIERHI